MNKTIEFFKEVKAESYNVSWPTRNQTIMYTVAVLVLSLAMAYFLGLFDSLFTKGLEYLLNN